MDNKVKGFAAASESESTASAPPAGPTIEQLSIMVVNLQRVCHGLVQMYTSMHNTLISELEQQLNFKRDVYLQKLKEMSQAMVDESTNPFRDYVEVEDGAVKGDIIKAIIKCTVDEKVISNDKEGGTLYELGSGQLIPEIDNVIVGHKKGEKLDFALEFPSNINIAGNRSDVAKYEIEILTVLRKKNAS